MITSSTGLDDGKCGSALIDAVSVQSISIDLAQLLDYVREQFAPDDVFAVAALDEWATENGYVQRET